MELPRYDRLDDQIDQVVSSGSGATERAAMVRFYIPLPEPLGMPDQMALPVLSFPQPFDQFGLLVETDEGLVRNQWGSICFRQIDTPLKSQGLREAIAVAAEYIPDGLLSGLFETETAGAVTVIDVAVFVDLSEEDPIFRAFQEALDEIQRLGHRYHLVTKLTNDIVTLRSLPIYIPFKLGAVDFETGDISWQEQFDLYVNEQSVGMENVVPPQLSDEQIDLLIGAPYDIEKGPFAAFTNLRREAMLAVRDHKVISAAALIGASYEALFRELYLVLLWEEGKCPEEVAKKVEERLTITKLVKSQFGSRLGGSWHLDRAGPIQDWKTAIKDLRDQVLHTGRTPSLDEIDEATQASVVVEQYVSDRLANSFSSYPLPAWFFMGPQGFEQRELTQRWDIYSQTNLLPKEPQEQYSNWRREVDRHVNNGPFEGDLDKAELALIKYANGRRAWWIVDQDTGLACLAETPTLPASQQARIDESLSDPEAVGNEISMLLIVDRLPKPLHEDPEWCPRSLVMPLGRVSRYAESLVPPSLEIMSFNEDLPEKNAEPVSSTLFHHSEVGPYSDSHEK